MVAGDIRFALRQIARTPLFSGVVIAVIALGIGINAGLLTVLDTYVWRPAPGIPADASLARLAAYAKDPATGHVRSVPVSYPDIEDLRRQNNVFADVAGWRAASLAVDFGGGAEPVSVVYATANYFTMLRVPLAAGTGFPRDADRATEPVVVIVHSLWTSHFGGAADAIGRSIRIRNQPFTIVGVAPPRFFGINVTALNSPMVWVPLGAAPIIERSFQSALVQRQAMLLQPIGRLAPGVEAGDIAPRIAPLAARMAREDPVRHDSFQLTGERLTGMRADSGGTQELIVAFLLVAVLVVVITCTNVSALLIGRAVSRRREIGVRLSLGATHLRIVRQMLTESLVFAIAGGVLGLVLYAVTMKIAYATVPEVIWGFEPKAATFLAAAAFALTTTIAVGLAPALHASRTGAGEAMKNGGSQGIRRARLQSAFVVAQLACSMPVLVVTSLVLVNLRAAATSEADEPPASVLAMDTELRAPSVLSGSITRQMRDSAVRVNRATYDLARQRLEGMTGVRSVTLSASAGSATFEAPDAGTSDSEVRQVHVSAAHFATLGIPILRGRAFSSDEDRAGFTGVVINEETARRLWPGQDPVGKRIVRRDRDEAIEGIILNSAHGSPASLEVMGVAGSLSYEGNRTTPMLYTPLANAQTLWGASIAVRTGSPNARPLLGGIRSTLREVDPLITVTDVATLAERYENRAREERLANLGAFTVGVAALLLASLGLYAIIAFGVAQRTREIGVRLAIGATSGDVVRQFLHDGLKVTAIAMAIGIPITLAGIRIVQSQQANFTLRNIGAVLLVVPVLAGIATIASWLPARRAGRVDPLIALRSE
jgi:predicted permease